MEVAEAKAAPCVEASEVAAAVVATMVAEVAMCIMTMLNKVIPIIWMWATMMVVVVTVVAVIEVVVPAEAVADLINETIIRTTTHRRRITNVKTGEEKEVTLNFFSLLRLILIMINSFMDLYPQLLM